MVPPASTYWVILWREGDDWGWLKHLDGNRECTTQDANERRRYSCVEQARSALWKFKANNPKRPNETIKVVRVSVRMKGRVELRAEDLKVVRLGEHGWRITYRPTGDIVECYEELSSLKNKAKALGQLREVLTKGKSKTTTTLPLETIHECRTCDRSIVGPADATSPLGAVGESIPWRRIANIDGPDTICPDCQCDPDALVGLRQEYPNAVIVDRGTPNG